MSYMLMDEFMWLGLGSMVNRFRKDVLGLSRYVCMYVCMNDQTHEEDLSAFKTLSLCMYEQHSYGRAWAIATE